MLCFLSAAEHIMFLVGLQGPNSHQQLWWWASTEQPGGVVLAYAVVVSGQQSSAEHDSPNALQWLLYQHDERCSGTMSSRASAITDR
jgi:hypothetical protein